MRKGTEEEFLLSKGDLIFPVKEGDTLDGTYRVVAVRADGIELVSFRWALPSALR